jgi:hypothetical protein
MNLRFLQHNSKRIIGACILVLAIVLSACSSSAPASPATLAPTVARVTAASTVAPKATTVPTALPPTSTPTTVPPTAAPPTGAVSFGPATFSYDLSIASTVTTTHIAGQNPGGDMPYWGIFPDYDEYNLVGYPSKNTYHKPRIEIYPVAEYEQINPGAKDVIAGLKKLLTDKPSSPQRIPLLPLFNAAQVFHAQLQYLSFQTGQGVRFVSQYDQAPIPINNLEVFYTFQGLTADGKYYITALLPVSIDLLPDSDQVTAEMQQQLNDFGAYLKGVTQKIDGAKPQDFTPNLNLLDAMIQALSVK